MDRLSVWRGSSRSSTLPGGIAPPAHDPCDEWYRHFRRCFFCHFGDRYTSDYFCETGRELNIAILDECEARIEWA